MLQLRLFALPLLTFALACRGGGQSSSPAPAAGTESAILALMQESAAAWNRADIAGHVALYTDSAAMMGRNGPIPGKDAIRRVLERGFWQEGRPLQQLGFSELVVTPLGRGFAMLTGKFTLTGGGRAEATGRFTTIWTRTPAGWRIIHDHSS